MSQFIQKKTVEKNEDCVFIQIGNSASPSNKHLEVFQKIEQYKNNNIKIIVPLMYGASKDYINDIVQKGKNIFGDKFSSITEFLPQEEYSKRQSQIDIAIFYHDRQEAMGNIISLLGFGVKVYLKSNFSPWDTLKKLNIELFDSSDEINIEPLTNEFKQKNINIMKDHFSFPHYLNQLEKLFNQKLTQKS